MDHNLNVLNGRIWYMGHTENTVLELRSIEEGCPTTRRDPEVQGFGIQKDNIDEIEEGKIKKNRPDEANKKIVEKIHQNSGEFKRVEEGIKGMKPIY